MPRIPESDIERLKEEVSVQRLVESAGIALKKAGKDWLGCCHIQQSPWSALPQKGRQHHVRIDHQPHAAAGRLLRRSLRTASTSA